MHGSIRSVFGEIDMRNSETRMILLMRMMTDLCDKELGDPLREAALL